MNEKQRQELKTLIQCNWTEELDDYLNHIGEGLAGRESVISIFSYRELRLCHCPKSDEVGK